MLVQRLIEFWPDAPLTRCDGLFQGAWFTMNAIKTRAVLAACLLLVTTTTLRSQTDEPNRRVKGARPGGSVSVIHKMFPDFDVYHLSYEDYEQKRLSDIVELNATLYELTAEERTRISSMIQKFDNAPTEQESDKAAREEFQMMINQRANIARTLSSKFDVDKADSKVAQEFLESSGLIKNQPAITRYEAARSQSVQRIHVAIEEMIGPARVEEAYSQWDYRLMQARQRVAIKTLVDTLGRPEAVGQRSVQVPREAPPSRSKPTAMRQNRPAKMTPAGRRPPSRTQSKPAAKKRDARKTKNDTSKSKASKRTAKPDRKSRRSNRAPKPVPLDKWEQYVRDFLRDYECTPEQTHSALSILGELKDRATSHEAANKKRLDAANKIKDRRERQKRIAAINAPIDRLFDQLKRRLEGLLTTHQRAIKNAASAKTGRRSGRR